MRVDLTTYGMEPPENSKPGRAGQTGSGSATSGVSGNSFSGASGSALSGASALDDARFSFNQTRVESLKAQVLAQPEVRGGQVRALQQAIGNGEYSIPPSQIANAMANDLAG